MYVIWRKRTREHYAGWDNVGDVRLTPIIVQSRRVRGKPRQEHVACLPSILDSQINEKGAVWFWDAVEKQLTRLTNRIPCEEMEKIRGALDKVVPQPQPEYAKTLNDNAQAFMEGMTAALASKFGPNTRETNERIAVFSDSFKTSKRGKPDGHGVASRRKAD